MKLHNDISFTFDDTKIEGKGRHFVSRFIEPGAVSYGKAGVLKVTKEVLDKFIQSFVGCPIVIKHQNITAQNADEKRVGVVNGVWYDAKDGWFYCDGIIWNEDAIKKIENGWTVSCCYDMTDSTGESGEWHNMHFDDELLNGVFLHLAIVPNPRYEDATIKFNSKDRDNEMLFKLFNGKKVQNSNEEQEMDKNALKNKLMEHINKAVKGKGDIGDQSEEDWYKELREMLDKLAYSESEDKKSNEKEEDKKEDSDKEKENECKKNADDEDKGEKADDKKEDKDDKEDKEEDKSEKENRKSNSKDFDEMNRLHNFCGPQEKKSEYINQASRIELGNKLF